MDEKLTELQQNLVIARQNFDNAVGDNIDVAVHKLIVAEQELGAYLRERRVGQSFDKLAFVL